MRIGRFMPVAAAVFALLLVHAGAAKAADPAALAGRVTSAEEGAMEGVLVSAKATGSTIETTVVTDKTGRYAFPAARLVPGHYSLAIRAAGYELAGPGAADLAAGKTTTADLELRKTAHPETQLSNAEWMLSVPGTPAQKDFLSNCVECHTVQRIFSSTHTADEFLEIFKRMSGYSPGSVPERPQPLVGGPQRSLGTDAALRPMAEFLARANLSGGRKTWTYPLRRLPRPTGAATRVIITEYDLPRPDALPHDVMLDADGMVWYSDFGQQYLGEMDPRTGKVTDYKVPVQKPGFPMGGLDIETDKAGNIWLAEMYQTGAVRLDRKTRTFKVFPLPAAWQADHTQDTMVSPMHSDVDGKVYLSRVDLRREYRLDPATGKYEDLGTMTDAGGRTIGSYGIPTDLENNLYALEIHSSNIGRYDAKTGKVKIWTTPTPLSGPRRGRVDAHDRIWFAEYHGNGIGMFDPRTEKITEWKLPTPWGDPYDVVAAKNGDVWTGSMESDFVYRLDPASGAFVSYLLPHETNIRRVFVDDRTSPETLWVGSNHAARIVKVEPLN